MTDKKIEDFEEVDSDEAPIQKSTVTRRNAGTARKSENENEFDIE